MAIASMTGFARTEGGDAAARWAWEARSVNGKSLDVRIRAPGGLDALEADARKAVADRFARGSVSLNLTLDEAERPKRVKVNAEALTQILAAARALSEKSGLAPASADGVLGLRGVLEMVEDPADETERDGLAVALRDGLAAALTGLETARAEEGARLETVLNARLDEVAALADQAETAAAARNETIADRLKAGLAAWRDLDAPMAEDRIAHEAALLIVKADVREELDRLRAHIAAIRELIAGGGPIGRKLDFMCQELNREANTLCSKAQDPALTRVGVDLKTVIDQLREQAQNIE